MRRGYRLKRRKKESVLLFAALFITGMLIYAGLANWERTPHLYEYDKKSLAKEIKAADANRQASKEEDAESKTRKEPKKQWKRQEKKDNSIKKQNTSKADKKQTDGTGDESVPGGKDGGSGVPDLPDQQVTEGDGGQQPEETVDDAKATQTPKPSTEPDDNPKNTDKPEETDRIISLSCEWSEKDNLLYGKDISMDGMKVTAKYESGKTSRLAKGAYVVRGLNNNSVGKHNMTISSGGAECRISYTINNYTKSLTYSWPTKDECYTEEDFSDGALTVQVLMADGTKQEITKYEITGYNEKLFDKQQTFTITYKDKVIDKTFTATGTCTFHMRSMRIRCYYYRDESLTDLAGSYSYAGNYDYYSDERVSLNAFRKDDLQDKDTMYNSKKICSQFSGDGRGRCKRCLCQKSHTVSCKRAILLWNSNDQNICVV